MGSEAGGVSSDMAEKSPGSMSGCTTGAVASGVGVTRSEAPVFLVEGVASSAAGRNECPLGVLGGVVPSAPSPRSRGAYKDDSPRELDAHALWSPCTLRA